MNLYNKSESNIKAAKLLIDNNIPEPSVHCSYYGCFQKMKSIIAKFLNISYDDLDRQIQSDSFHRTEHCYIWNKIEYDIEKENRLHDFERREIFNSIKKLYKFRVTSDYKNEAIPKNKAEQALRLSTDIINYLNKAYST